MHIPKVGDKVRLYATHGPVAILEVSPYTGKYQEIFTHTIRYLSPVSKAEVDFAWGPGNTASLGDAA